MGNSTPPNHVGIGHLLRIVPGIVGIPAVVFAIIRWVFGLPFWLAIILSLLAVPLGGYVSRVWALVQEPLAKRTAKWILTEGSYYQQYCQQVLNRNRFRDVQGMEAQEAVHLSLAEVFIEPDVVQQRPAKISSSPIPTLPKDAQEKRRYIWGYLTSKRSAKNHLVILGARGSGKTILLKHVALTFVATGEGLDTIRRKRWYLRNISAGDERHPRQFKVPYKLPILLAFSDYAKTIAARPNLSLAQLVGEYYLPRDAQNKPIIPTKWIERKLKKGQCLILLDELGDVVHPKIRGQVLDWVQKQMDDYGANQFILTSRPFAYPVQVQGKTSVLKGTTVLTVPTLADGQMKRLIRKRYVSKESRSTNSDIKDARDTARGKAEDFLHQLYNNQSRVELSANPSLLMMMVIVHDARQAIPDRQVDLYAEICNVFLSKKLRMKGSTVKLTPAQQQRVLQALAYQMMCAGQREISLADALTVMREPLALISPKLEGEPFLEMVENASGLLLKLENGCYSFALPAFQEYLAAVHIKEKHLEGDLLERVSADWWHETLYLYSAQSDATAIIDACLDSQPLSAPVLELAHRCAAEGKDVQEATRSRLENLLEQGLGDTDIPWWRVVAEAKLRRRLQQMPRLKEAPDAEVKSGRRAQQRPRLKEVSYRDTSLISCAEYQLFLEAQHAGERYYWPDHWTGEQFEAGKGNSPILGIRASDATAFCAWLNEDKLQWKYRLPRVGEIPSDELGDMQGRGYWAVSKDSTYSCDGQHSQARTKKELEPKDKLVEWLKLDLSKVHTAFHDFASLRGSFLESGVTLDRYISLDLSLTRTQALKGAHDLNTRKQLHQALIPSYNVVPELARVLGFDNGLEATLSQTLDCAMKRTRAPAVRSDWKNASQFLRLYIRLSALFALQDLRKKRKFLPKARRERAEAIKAYCDLYIDFAILEERALGTLQPFEGILLVKERKEAREQAEE